MGWLFGVLGALVVLFFWRKSRFYHRLYGSEHLVEVGQIAVRLKAAATSRIIVDDQGIPTPPEDARTALTSAGLAVLYTVRQDGSQFVHHCSISIAGGYTAHAVGAMFGVMLAQLFAFPPERTSFGIGASTVHHVQAVLDEAEHAALLGTPVPVVSPENAAEIQRLTFEAGQQVSWQRIGPPTQA